MSLFLNQHLSHESHNFVRKYQIPTVKLLLKVISILLVIISRNLY